MDVLLNNLPETLMVAGILAMIVELAVLGMATFVLLFLGASLLLTGLAMSIGLLPDTGTAALWSNAVVTALLAALLWQPLKRMQNQRQSKNIDSDFARQTFVLEDDIDASGNATYLYSGIRWKLKSKQPLSKGTLVEVVKADVGTLWVKVCDSGDSNT